MLPVNYLTTVQTEDVVSFEKAVVGRDKEGGRGAEHSSGSECESDKGEDNAPMKRKVRRLFFIYCEYIDVTLQTAARSIMAFLADQSDSE